jgi:hypothetical protein
VKDLGPDVISPFSQDIFMIVEGTLPGQDEAPTQSAPANVLPAGAPRKRWAPAPFSAF